jgi:predicted nucleic acid-binding protein
MELSQLVKGRSVFLDTAPLIYFIEKHPVYHPVVKPVIIQIGALAIEGLTSTITLLEVLVHPLRDGNNRLADKYKAILLYSNGLTTHEVSHEISARAASLRAKYGLKTPDAIQLATAMQYQADYFLTNDPALRKVRDMDVLVLDDFVQQANTHSPTIPKNT